MYLSGLNQVVLQANKSITTTAAQTGVDISSYEGYGVLSLAVSAAVAGTNPTIDVKIEQSADNSSWDSTAVVTFTQSTAVDNQSAVIKLDECKKYIRVYNTIGGTSSPQFYTSVILSAKKKVV